MSIQIIYLSAMCIHLIYMQKSSLESHFYEIVHCRFVLFYILEMLQKKGNF